LPEGRKRGPDRELDLGRVPFFRQDIPPLGKSALDQPGVNRGWADLDQDIVGQIGVYVRDLLLPERIRRFGRSKLIKKTPIAVEVT
jgi:hypothetical protein